MGDLLGHECRSESREAAKKTQSQLHFSKGAKDHPLEFSLQHASWNHPKTSRHHRCKNFLSPPEKLISGILGIIWFALLVALVISARVASPYIEPKEQNYSLMIRTQKLINHNLSSAHPCGHCPMDGISFSHNCYYVGVEKKSWNDSLESCISKTCDLLYINSEEEMDFLKSLSVVSWIGVFRKSRSQPWVWKNDSTFKPKLADFSHDEHNCAMLSTSGLTAENCATLHSYVCKCKPTS
ncbi:NKG2-A/NKG2-B type II integral membrane protein-like [Meriones unguiculatus]|uniref:NKG2-A/NKG2-B type II integral membrane protein-like n=1 Tax=Meriones unguiculatus TaxID=10047 RepID=UPI00293EC7F1|nr:NKG2-A/NKG2-B type II integral membrane protein-like [Meriones unguiculatus]